MGTFSLWHWIIVLIVILVVFGGRGKISSLMGDIGKGFRSLKNELDKKEDVESLDSSPEKTKKFNNKKNK